MWRWTVFLYLLVFYGHTSSQPVSHDSENARQTRQLDFGECCPCPGAGQAGQGFGTPEYSTATGGGPFARASGLDDCPCRIQHADSEGASSIFFPTSMRSDGPVVRPVDKKEDLKPLLHPEVDLASSVLQTLREATDEEYQDALARDAARSIAKAADATIFEDALPEASGNIVTIIVNPKQTDNLDDVIPQQSHTQESRCIREPLESVSTNLGKMRVTPKPPRLLRDIFGLPRISKPAGLLHRNSLDMDNGMGASNIQEHVVHIDKDQVTDKSIQGLRKFAPKMKLDTNIKEKSTNMESNGDDQRSVSKGPNFKLPLIKNKLKDFLSNRSSLQGKGKINSLPLIPKMRLNNSLSKAKWGNIEDMNLKPSNIQEQAKINFFQTKSHLENILQKTKPIGLKNLLKLKDVELIPLKDLVHKTTEMPTFVIPDYFNKGDNVIMSNTNKNPINLKTTEILKKKPFLLKDEILDHDVSPSNVIEQISENNCHNEPFKRTKMVVGGPVERLTSTEIIDTASSSSDIQSAVSVSQSDELSDKQTNNCNIQNFPVAETNLTPTMENSFNDETQDNNEGEVNLDTSNERTPDNVQSAVSVSQSNEIADNTDDCNIQTLPVAEKNLTPSIKKYFDEETQDNNVGEVGLDTSNERTPDNVQSAVSVSQSNEIADNTDNSNIQTLPVTEKNLTPSMENSFDDETQNNNEGEVNLDTSNERTPDNVQSAVSFSPSNEIADNTDDCNIQTLPVAETNLTQSMENSFDDEILDNNEGEITLDISNERTPDNVKGKEDPESKYISNDEDCVINNNDADSITDSSNNINSVLYLNDTILENSNDSLVDKNIVTEESCSQELPTSDYSNPLGSNTQRKLIKPLSLHKTLSSIKENVIKHLENLKNPKTKSKGSGFFGRETSENIIEDKETFTDEKLDSDCQNKESIQLTTIKPGVLCNDDLDSDNEPPRKVSMQDLQKISDEMLQREQERESKTMECSELSQKVSDQNIPLEMNSREKESINFEQSANTQNEVIMIPQNSDDISDKNENNIENTCQSDLMLPKQSFVQEPDANAEASEIVIKSIPQSNDNGSPLLLSKVLQPDEPAIKFAPIPTLDEIKLNLTKLFDKTAQDAEKYSASEADSMTDTSNILRPIMATDASTTNFQLTPPPLRLEDINLANLQLKPSSGLLPKIPKIDLHSYKTKFPLPTELGFKPIKLQSVLEDKIVGRNNLRPSDIIRKKTKVSDNPWETFPNLDNFGTRAKTNTQKIAKLGRKPDTLRKNLIPNQGIGDLSDIHSHAKHALRSMQQTLESRFREATKKPLKLQNNDLLDAISRNHEDINDKLKALHIDFNDRIETMRNNLFDKSIFGSSESRKSFSAFGNQNKNKELSLKTVQPKLLTSRRESKKTLKPRRLEQQRSIGIGSSQKLPNKFKMPAAASVPVPRTIEVPELKATLTKSPGLAIQRASDVNPNIHSTEASKVKESPVALWKQSSKKFHNSNTRLGNSINPFKDSKIKVIFSTTPQPTIPPRLQSRKFSMPSSLSQTGYLGKNTGRFGQEQDYNGSPNEIKGSIITLPISSHLDQHNLQNYGMDSGSRQLGASNDELPRKLSGKDNVGGNAQPILSDDLQSWPKVSESAFLSKVKDAVKARLSKVNSPVTFTQSDARSVSTVTNTDMTRSASENIDVIKGQALKENVSYKCTMVCTKE